MKHLIAGLCLTMFCFANGIYANEKLKKIDPNPVLDVPFISEQISVDGFLKEDVWKKTGKWIPLLHFQDEVKRHRPIIRKQFEKGVIEKGFFKILYDKKNLYVGIRAEDTDVVAEMPKDQEYHFRYGDVVEIFLKPANASYYWELYVTPRNNTSVFFYPSQGRHSLPSDLPKVSPLKKYVARAFFDGTMNNSDDTDRLWTAEFAIPLDEIAAKGIPFTSGENWTFLICRANYSKALPWIEWTAFPTKNANAHAYEYYSKLKLTKQH